ncbi:hypothetical protein GGE58_002805 [Rhizobium lentis]|nr:hypothetical protein [Rhizobium lentis]
MKPSFEIVVIARPFALNGKPVGAGFMAFARASADERPALTMSESVKQMAGMQRLPLARINRRGNQEYNLHRTRSYL